MFPIDILSAMCKSRKLWPLLPFVFLALLPVTLFLIVATMALHAGIGLLLWFKGCEYWLREWRKTARYERSIGRHWRACVADRARLHMADLTAWLHSRCLAGSEYVDKSWRRWVYWAVFGPIAVVLAVVPALVGVFLEWCGEKHDELLRFLDRTTFAKFRDWSIR